MMKLSIFLSIMIAMIVNGFSSKAQFLDNSLFRIYRAEFIGGGAVTQLRFDSDNSYQINVIEIHCSLCDHDELLKSINSQGCWRQSNDTVYLDGNKKLLIIGDSLVKPLFLLGFPTDSLSYDKRKKLKQGLIDNKLMDFHLIYDTYPNGVARLIVDKYRMRREEYEIEFKPSGVIKNMRYYWDDKQRKRLR